MTTTTATGPETLARRFQALSDEKRLRILEILADGERCVCDLTEALDVGQSLLSFHLRTLREAGLVSDRREGRWAYYSLVSEVLAELQASLRNLRGESSDAGGNGDPGTEAIHTRRVSRTAGPESANRGGCC